MEMNGVAFRILNGINRKYPASYSDLVRSARFKSRDEYDKAVDILLENGYITGSGTEIVISPAGIKYIQDLTSTDLKIATKDIKHDYDFALVRFLHDKPWPVLIEEFPEILKAKAADYIYDSGSEEFKLLLYLYRSSYFKEEQSLYSLTPSGIAFYENEIEELNTKQNLHTATAAVHFTDNSTKIVGDGNKIVTGNNNSLNENTESEESTGLAKKSVIQNKFTIILSVIAIIVSIVIYLLQRAGS